MTSLFLALIGVALSPRPSSADQGGLSFWLPGSFGSLSAIPMEPGWTLGTVYYHTSADAGGDVAASRSIHLPGRTVPITFNLNAAINGDADLAILAPGYTFEQPILGGRFTASLLAIVGSMRTTIDAKVEGALGPIGFGRSLKFSDSLFSAGDLFPEATLKWNDGVNNYLVYGMTNIPVGDYDPNRLANLGLGHWSIDGGAGYTYLNTEYGREFSFVTGLTYNAINSDLEYRNGIDWHLDWGLSQFLSKEIHIGLVGYVYQQLTGDSGDGAVFGDFKSRVFGIGPQVGYLFPLGSLHGYINLKGYGEFAADRRASGWNLWLTFGIAPAG
jgi:hypothetical protein